MLPNRVFDRSKQIGQKSPSTLSCPSAINRCCKFASAASTTPSDGWVSLDDMLNFLLTREKRKRGKKKIASCV